MNDKIEFSNYNISIGHYLFYMGIFDQTKFQKKIFEDIDDSIEAIKSGIRIIANDFIKREEYNAYKHGLRILPALSELMFFDLDTKLLAHKVSLKDSMSFILRTNRKSELTVLTKVFDSERDYQMTLFCSHLIHHLIFYRRLVMKKNKGKKGNGTVALTFFGKEQINECNKINVEIQDLKYTVKRKYRNK